MSERIRLSKNEATLLVDMINADAGREYCYPFATIAGFTSLDKTAIRRTVRALARKGLAVFVRGLMNEDGDLCGSGYGITSLGCEVAKGLPQ